MGRDLDAVHRAHIALLDSYFDRMESDVNVFVDSEYRAYSIERNMKDFKLVDKVRDPSTAGGGLDALDAYQFVSQNAVSPVAAGRPTP